MISADIPGWRRHHVRDRLGEPIKSIQNFIMTLDTENQTAGFLKLAFDVAHWFLDAAHNELSLPSQSLQSEHASNPGQRVSTFRHSSDRIKERLVDVLLWSALQHSLSFDKVSISSYSRYGMCKTRPSRSSILTKTRIPVPEPVGKEQLELWQTKSLRAPIRHTIIVANVVIDMVKGLQTGSPETHFQILITGSAHLVGQSLVAFGGEQLVMTLN
ncbi:hypothetical protein MY3296_002659 [Beauveria thailandica]